MLLGAGFPTLDLGGDPEIIRYWAEFVEAMGFSHILAYEHVLGFDSKEHIGAFGLLDARSRFHEPFVLLGFLAAVTRRVELVTGVLVLPQRQTALVAKQAAEVDVLSGGRLRLGVGVGWNEDEFGALNANFHDRGRRSQEQIAVLRAFWTEQPTTFSGRWHQLDRVGIAPLPVQRPIPIWMGTHAEAGLRRLGQLADGWMPAGRPGLKASEIQAMHAHISAAALSAGRDPASLGIDPQVVFIWLAESEWGGYASAWREHGATHLTVTTMGLGTNSVDDHLAALRHVRDELSAAGVLSSA